MYPSLSALKQRDYERHVIISHQTNLTSGLRVTSLRFSLSWMMDPWLWLVLEFIPAWFSSF